MPSQVTKALIQVPATDAAGPLLPPPSPFLGCWAGSVPQAVLSCSSFFTKGLLQEGQFSPKHQEGLVCHFGASMLKTGFPICLGGQFLPDPSHIPFMHCLLDVRWRYDTSHWPPMPHREPTCVIEHQYLYMKQYAGWTGSFLLSGSKLWLKIILI